MTKLRLIKPWGLRIVRQHTYVVLNERMSPAMQCCTGPVGACEDVFSRRHHHEIRTVKDIVDTRAAHRRIAPVVCGSQLPPAISIR